jgi:hypothetical protein
MDDETQLALALSLSTLEAERKGPLGAAVDDETFARHLQQQWERERAAAPPPRPLPPAPTPPQRPGPAPAPPADASNAASASDPGACGGCGAAIIQRTGLGGLFSGGGGGTTRWLTALGRSWHPACFTCAGCARSLAGDAQFSVGADGRPYHPACHRALFHPRCGVCAGLLPTEDGGARVVWSSTPFWGDKSCPAHADDGTPRCTACSRLQPRAEAWATLRDARALCLRCLGTAVVDTAAAQPLYDDVLSFYASLGMPLPARPPLALVDDGALNAAVSGQTGGRGRGEGPVFHTRGLCLTEYLTQTTTTISGGLRLPFGAPRREEVRVGPTQVTVTAILVLFGLPRLLTGSILAHEAMHAWLRLTGYPAMTPDVEEGLCQLLALLWLEAQPGAGGGGAKAPAPGSPAAYEERLAAFFGNQIRTDASVVYGDGLRAALEAFQRHGLAKVLAHVKQTASLPP